MTSLRLSRIILDCCPFTIFKITNGYPSLQPFQKIFKKRRMNRSNEEINSVLYGE